MGPVETSPLKEACNVLRTATNAVKNEYGNYWVLSNKELGDRIWVVERQGAGNQKVLKSSQDLPFLECRESMDGGKRQWLPAGDCASGNCKQLPRKAWRVVAEADGAPTKASGQVYNAIQVQTGK